MATRQKFHYFSTIFCDVFEREHGGIEINIERTAEFPDMGMGVDLFEFGKNRKSFLCLPMMFMIDCLRSYQFQQGLPAGHFQGDPQCRGGG